MSKPHRGRRVLLLVGLCFATPFLASMLLNKLGWMPSGRKNYGELVTPPVPLAPVQLKDASAFPWKTPPEWYWTLLVRLPEQCIAGCRTQLDLVPNLRTALARNAIKLRIAVVDPLPEGAALGSESGVYLLSQPVEASVAAALPRPQQAPRLALVDPNGYVVLRYPEDADFSGVRKDLGKLLK
jgi:hypothetical protein